MLLLQFLKVNPSLFLKKKGDTKNQILFAVGSPNQQFNLAVFYKCPTQAMIRNNVLA